MISTYLANKLLDHLLGGGDFSSPATIYAALFTVTPAANGTGGTEASGGGYVRKAITNNLTNFPASSGGSKSIGPDTALFTASGAVSASANMVAIGFYDASSGGNLLAVADIATPYAIANGDTPTIFAGTGFFTLDSPSGGFGNTVRDGLLDLAFGRVSYTRASNVYGALFISPNSSAGGGSEVSGGSYARKIITNNSTNFPAASAASKALNVTTPFVPATAGWGVVTDFALFDSSSGGNLVFFKSLTTARTVLSGQTFRIDAGGLTVTIV